MTASLFQTEIVFQRDMTVTSLEVLSGQPPAASLDALWLVFAPTAEAAPRSLQLLASRNLGVPSAVLQSGGWFGVVANTSAAAHLFFNLGGPLQLRIGSPRAPNWLTVRDAALPGQAVHQGANWSATLFSLGIDMLSEVQSVSELLALRTYIAEPSGLSIIQGQAVPRNRSLLQVTPTASGVVELKAERALTPAKEGLLLPLMAGPFCSRWTVGLWQHAGYTLDSALYNATDRRYTSLGLDDDGYAYAPLYTGRADTTHVSVGHPVTLSGAEAEAVFVQVTRVTETAWYVELNNPLEREVRVGVRVSLPLPGLRLAKRSVTLPPGGVVLVSA